MKKQNDLQWFLIKKFIEILAVVGVVEYLLTFLVNRFVLPNVLLYFFPAETVCMKFFCICSKAACTIS